MLQIFATISSLSILVPFFVGLKFYKSFRSNTSKTFFIFIVLTMITELMNVGLSLLKINNVWLNNIYVFVPLIAFQLILNYEKAIAINLSNFFNLILIIIYSVGFINLEKIFNFNPIHYVISSFILAIFCVMMLFKVFDHAKIIDQSFVFWISSGMLFYASTTLVLYGLLNIFMTSYKQLLWFYIVPQTIVNVTVNLVFAKALYGTNEK